MSESMVRPVNLEGFSHLYTIDEYGNIFSLRKNRYLKPAFNSYFYPMVMLSSEAKDRLNHPNVWRMVHRIVAVTFIGPPPSAKHEINHKDHNKANSHYSNLEWVTHSQNILASYKDGFRKKSECGRDAGYKLSQEVKAKMASAKLKPVVATKDGVEHPFDSVDALCSSDIFEFKMYRKMFNRIMNAGCEYKGWSFEFSDKPQKVIMSKPILFGYKSEHERGEVNRYAVSTNEVGAEV
jgi:hypothetical protein